MSYKEFLADEIMEVVAGVLRERLNNEQATELDLEISQRVNDMIEILA